MPWSKWCMYVHTCFERILCTAASAFTASLQASMTCAPAPAIARAVSKPSPPLPPVMTTTLPLKSTPWTTSEAMVLRCWNLDIVWTDGCTHMRTHPTQPSTYTCRHSCIRMPTHESQASTAERTIYIYSIHCHGVLIIDICTLGDSPVFQHIALKDRPPWVESTRCWQQYSWISVWTCLI